MMFSGSASCWYYWYYYILKEGKISLKLCILQNIPWAKSLIWKGHQKIWHFFSEEYFLMNTKYAVMIIMAKASWKKKGRNVFLEYEKYEGTLLFLWSNEEIIYTKCTFLWWSGGVTRFGILWLHIRKMLDERITRKKSYRYCTTVTVLYSTVEASKGVTFCCLACEILRMITYHKCHESYYRDSQGNILQFQLQSVFHD